MSFLTLSPSKFRAALICLGLFPFFSETSDAQKMNTVAQWGKYGRSGIGLIHNDIAYIENGTTVEIFDVKDFSSPHKLSEIPVYHSVSKMFVKDHYLYVDNGFANTDVWSIKSPSSPERVNLLEVSTNISVIENYIYNPLENGIEVLNISSPAHSYEIARFEPDSSFYDLAAGGNHLYALTRTGNTNHIKVLDISKRREIKDTGHSYSFLSGSFSNEINYIDAYQSHVFILLDNSIVIVDFSNPEKSSQIGRFSFEDDVTSFSIHNQRLFVVSGNSFFLYDISNPAETELLAKWQHTEPLFSALAGDEYVVVSESSGLRSLIFDYSAGNSLTLKYEFTFENISPGGRGLQLSGHTAFLVQLNSLYAIDISDPYNPKEVTRFEPPEGLGRVSHLRGILVKDDYAYVMSTTGPFFSILDISNLPDITKVSSYSLNRPLEHSHSAVTDGDFLYIGDTSGLSIFDVRDKSNPARTFQSEVYGRTSDIEFYKGDLVYPVSFPENVKGLWIFNIDDKFDPAVKYHYPEISARRAALSGNFAYITTPDNEFLVVDVSDFANPVVQSSIKVTGGTYDICVFGNYVFVASIGPGVIAIDVTDKNNPFIFDIVETGRNTREIYQSNGLIYVMDASRGLTILEMDANAVSDYTPPDDTALPQPEIFQLKANFPNPFNPTTTINFRLDRASDAVLTIYSSTGKLVKKIVYASLPKGEHYFNWDGTNDRNQSVSSGVYIYRLMAAGFTQSRKMLLIK